MDGAMAPVEDVDSSEDEGLEDLDDMEEEADVRGKVPKEDRGPASLLLSATNSHAQPATVPPGARDRDDFLNARQLRIALFALCDGLHQASRVFSTQTQLILSWLKEARRRSKQTEQEPAPGDGRDRMVAWVLSMREQQLPITESNLFHKASTLKKKGSFSDSFRISYDWAVSFLLQHRLGVRSLGREATLARTLPLSLEAKIRTFRDFTQKVIKAKGLSQSTVAAMDELCIFVDLRLVQDRFRRPEALELTGSVPLVTVYLTVLANGTMLPSLVLANRQLAKKSLPESILLEAGTETLLVEEILDLWTNKVWLRHVSSQIQPSKSMLVLDRHREHLGELFLTSISGSGSLPAMIPGGCSLRLQPLEVCLKPVLQRFVLSRWAKLTSGDPEELQEASPQRLQANVAQLLVDWLVEALTHLTKLPELWKRSFHLTGLLPWTEDEEDGEKGTSRSPEEIQLELIRAVTEKLLGAESLEDSSPQLLELEDDDTEEEEQRERDEGQEDKDADEEKEAKEDKKEGEEEKETGEGGSRDEEEEEGQQRGKGLEDRMEQRGKDGEEEEEERKDTREDKMEEESEEEGKEAEEERKEASKERRETRIVIGEEVGDEWKITVKSRTDGVEADGDEDRMDKS